MSPLEPAREALDYVRTFAAFPAALRRFLARPTLTVEQARRMVS
jgi:hypothetical protein